MKGNRRFLSMGLGSIALVLLGFVVAVAARSRPGGADEALLEFDLDLGFDVTQILVWVILVLAILGTVLLVLGANQDRPDEDKRKRSWWGIALGILFSLVVLRYLRPLAEGLFEPVGAESVAASAIEDPSPAPGGNSAWLFSILIAAILVAALTRVGLTVRSADGSFDPPLAEAPSLSTPAWGPGPVAVALGADPRSRVIRAYAEFENVTAVAGVGRGLAETARHHGRRAATELNVNGNDISALIAIFSSTRFGRSEVTPIDAESAELLSTKLRSEIES